jgi:hypothetical protein
MSAAAVPTNNFVEVVAAELACGVDRAVESWLAEIEGALKDQRLTTLGRMYAVQAIVTRYKQTAGKDRLECRRPALQH